MIEQTSACPSTSFPASLAIAIEDFADSPGRNHVFMAIGRLSPHGPENSSARAPKRAPLNCEDLLRSSQWLLQLLQGPLRLISELF